MLSPNSKVAACDPKLECLRWRTQQHQAQVSSSISVAFFCGRQLTENAPLGGLRSSIICWWIGGWRFEGIARVEVFRPSTDNSTPEHISYKQSGCGEMHTGSHADCRAHRHCHQLHALLARHCCRSPLSAAIGQRTCQMLAPKAKPSQGFYEILAGHKSEVLDFGRLRLEAGSGLGKLVQRLMFRWRKLGKVLGTDFRACFKHFPQRE